MTTILFILLAGVILYGIIKVYDLQIWCENWCEQKHRED